MYEVIVNWETAHSLVDQPPVVQDFAEMWQAADKIVYSKTLETVSSARTRIERDFDPEAVRQMKAAAGRDVIVGGPDLAAQAIKAGLVDECQLFAAPIVVGGGKRSLHNNVRLKLELRRAPARTCRDFQASFSVATVVATRKEFLGLNGLPWNTWKTKIAS